LKPSKITMTLLAVALVFLAVSAVRADETETSPALAPEQSAPALDTPGMSCSSDEALSVPGTGQEPLPMGPQDCGACSTDGCAGALRGSLCWTGGVMGWGYCDLYTGGNRCPTGGWECSCGTGPIP
jgi:hypothetical protein